MSKDTYSKLIELLDQNGAKYRLIDHPPEGRTEIVSKMRGNQVSQAANCIVAMVKIGKKTTKFVLAVYPADKKLNLEAVKALFQGTYVSFATKEIAERLAGSVLGTVLPFSFDEGLELIVDPLLLKNEEIFFNAARLDCSIALRTSDYTKIANPRLENIAKDASSPPKVSQEKEPQVDDLHKLRHSLAHVLAQAVLKLWPTTKITIGPPIDYGCYYDFLFEKPVSESDFEAIEKEMKKIIKQGQTFRRDELSADDAKKYWSKRAQQFKVELIEDLEKNQGVKTVTHYANIGPKNEEMFVDLCRGGHVENLKEIPIDAFKIMHTAGAYWRGDEKREQLTRLYVAAFPTKKELDDYVTMLEEAAEADHRKLGKEMGLFTIAEVVGPGLPMLGPKGAIIRQELENWIRSELIRRDYSFAYTPNIGRVDLYKKSGHMSHFAENMFPPIKADDSDYILKPMNCPHHMEVYRSEQHSYRDMPVRIAEFGTVYRYEKSGQVGGLTRVRGFTQDDAHILMRPDQMEQEITGILDLAFYIYRTLGFNDFTLRLSLHDPANREKYIGTDENWSMAESALRRALEKMDLQFVEGVGEAAFYGPKIDLIVRDGFGREWQLGTIPQVDYNLPERFDLHYIDEKGEKKRPVMMHRAIFGSFERFIGVLIEHFKGLFPLWLAPVQIALIPVADTHEDHAKALQKQLKDAGVRTIFFDHTESLGKRIREGEGRKIPYLCVIGDKEVEADAVAVRNVKTKKQTVIASGKFVAQVLEDIRERKLELSIG